MLFLPPTCMYAQVSHLRYFFKHLLLPVLQRTLIDLLMSVFDFMTQPGLLLWE